MSKITITRALNEIKLLEKKINGAIGSLRLTDIVSNKYPDKTSNKNGYLPKEEFIKKAKADFQSVTDLIDRRNKMKSAINKSNALTEITVGNKTMTVAEAIETKSSIIFKQNLLKTVNGENFDIVAQKMKLDRQVQDSLDSLIATTFGRDKKTESSQVEELTKTYLATNGFEILDPVNTAQVATDLKEEIDNFVSDVDIALTESNSRVEIEL